MRFGRNPSATMQASAAQSHFASLGFMRRWSPEGERMGISGVIALSNFKHAVPLVVPKHRIVRRRARPCAQ
jgi:hypothetical protein